MEEIENLKERNRRVELDKAWETSLTRRITVALLTYIVASGWLLMIENGKPFLNALVPAGGYLLSTLSLPFVKRRWIKKQNHD